MSLSSRVLRLEAARAEPSAALADPGARARLWAEVNDLRARALARQDPPPENESPIVRWVWQALTVALEIGPPGDPGHERAFWGDLVARFRAHLGKEG